MFGPREGVQPVAAIRCGGVPLHRDAISVNSSRAVRALEGDLETVACTPRYVGDASASWDLSAQHVDVACAA